MNLTVLNSQGGSEISSMVDFAFFPQKVDFHWDGQMSQTSKYPL